MNSVAHMFRRNLVIAVVLHAALIAGIVLVEGVVSKAQTQAPIGVELVVPAALLGELPEGRGHGTGIYTPPSQPATAEAAYAPNEAGFTPEETAAPAPKPVAKPAPAPAHDPHEVLVPKKSAPTPKKSAVGPKTSATAESSAASTARVVKTAKSGTKTGSGTAVSAADYRRRFAKALLAAGEGGTPYGDNRAAGGGHATHGRYGSPDGSAEGIPGGVGQGSPFWQYYLDVHDKMYEAWERPADAADLKKGILARVVVRVARDGTILKVWLEDSSGNKLMDDSALAAARRVNRLKPLPDGLGAEHKDISVDFQLEG